MSTDERIPMSERHFVTNMRRLFSHFVADERGGRAIEFGLLTVGILVAIIAALAALGTGLDAAPSDPHNRSH
jgi:Flp pilus assembly pilin Flp